MSRWIFVVLPLVFAISFYYFVSVRDDRSPPHNAAEDGRGSDSPAETEGRTPSQSAGQRPDPAEPPAPAASNAAPEKPSAYAATWPNADLETHPLLKGDYGRHDIEELLDLIATGDETAMQVVAVKLVAAEPNEKNRRKAGDLMESAVIHGAREYPFRYLARDASRELRRAAEGQTTLSREASRSALVETFAYCELAAMRGNTGLKQSMIKALDQYGIRPSETIRADIETRAGMMFSQIQARREQLGLEPFGDSAADE